MDNRPRESTTRYQENSTITDSVVIDLYDGDSKPRESITINFKHKVVFSYREVDGRVVMVFEENDSRPIVTRGGGDRLDHTTLGK